MDALKHLLRSVCADPLTLPNLEGLIEHADLERKARG